MTRKRLLATGGFLGIAVALAVLLHPVCIIENVLGTSYLTNDAKWSVTLYSKNCSCRWSSKTREDWVLALRPMSEPAPQPPEYNNSEVIFEIEKNDNPRLVVGVTNPGAFAQFGDLSEAEKQHSLLVVCYPDCLLTCIRKQLHVWKGIPVHYLIEETEDGKSIIK